MRRMIGWIRLRMDGNEDLIMAERFFRDLLHGRRREREHGPRPRHHLRAARQGLRRRLARADRRRARARPGEDRERSARELAAKARALLEGVDRTSATGS